MPGIQNFSFVKFIGPLWWSQYKQSRYLFSKPNAATFQNVDIIFAVIHEATDQTVITENDGCHLGDILVTLIFSDVASVIHQAGDQVTFPNRFISTFFNLLQRKWLFYTSVLFYQTTFYKRECLLFSYWFPIYIWEKKRKALRNTFIIKKIVSCLLRLLWGLGNIWLMCLATNF